MLSLNKLGLASLLLLCGCSSFNHDYPRSKINLPRHWASHDKQTTTVPDAIRTIAWWKAFNDPQLERLIQDALANNNDIAIASGHILEAQAQLNKVQYQWLPSLGLAGSGFTGKFSESELSTPGPLNLPTQVKSPLRFNGYAAGFVPKYSLNILTNLKQHEAVKAELCAYMAEKNAVRLSVISQVAGSYFSLLGLKQQIALQQQLIQDAQLLRRLTNIQYQQGANSKMELAALSQLIATLQKKIPSLHHDLTKVQNALHVLTNTNPGRIKTNNTFNNIHTNGIIPINCPAKTLRTRPDVLMAEYQLQASHAMIGVAASELFPAISLTGLLGGASLELKSLLNIGSHLGPGLNTGLLIAQMPLLSMEVQAKIAQAKGKQYIAYFHYLQTIREAMADVDNALSQHASVDEQFDKQYKALQSAKEQYHIVTLQYQQGAIGYPKTLFAKLNVDYMNACLNQAKMQQIRSIVKLYQAFGGGVAH